MDKERVISILKNKTLMMFNESWYSNTANELLSVEINELGYVYFFRYENSPIVKIGKSSEIMKRLQSFSTGNHSRIILIGYIYCSDYDKKESELHIKYKDKRNSGEWFSLSQDEVFNEIKSNDGVYCNSILNKKLVISDGVFISGDSLSYNDEYENFLKIFSLFNELITLDYRHNNDEFFDTINLPITKKKLSMLLKDYANRNNFLFIKGNTNGKRWFKISKKESL